MKIHLLILFTFLISPRVFPQMAPPDLRCIEVLDATGTVKLTWIPPNDPQNIFYGYAIYASNSSAGPFNLVNASSSSISQNTFTHAPTTATVQPMYYYVCSLSGAAGTNTSNPSDTLHTIFLNINTVISETYKLTFNNPHDPRLTSSVPSFTVFREYPTGIWTKLAETNALSFNDTISICNSQGLQINYQVFLKDNSGCSSASNFQGGVYHDKHDPSMLNVDSISVLPDGSTILAWIPPVDKDVVKYEIQRKDQNGLNSKIDSLKGYIHTYYLLSGTAANTGTVGVYVKGIDSCGNGGGVVDYAPTTMFLSSYYDYCGFKTELSWTPYHWATVGGVPVDEVQEYRVYVSSDSGATYTQIGVTSATNFSHNSVTAGKNTVYYVRMFSKKRKMTSSTNRRHFYAGEVPSPSFVYIKNAPVIKKNTIEVQIYVDPKATFKQINIFKSEGNGDFKQAGTIPFGAVANYTFTDEKVSTDHKYYAYQARIVDSCGNPRINSNIARPILLTITADDDNVFERHLSWTPYSGFDAGVQYYEIYRSVRDAGIKEYAGRSDSITEFADNLEYVAPIGARIEYQVLAVEGPNNQYGVLERASSNDADAYMEGRIFVPNAFAPDGLNKTWKPITHFVVRQEYNVSVYNRLGQLVFEANNPNDAWNGANCPNDVYNYIVTFKNSRGEYEQVAGHVLLMR